MLDRFISYVRGLIRRRKVETETDDELRFHVEMETEANRARGLSVEEARRVALRDLGGMTQTREAVRAVRTVWIDAVRQHLLHAVQGLRTGRGFVAVGILSVAIGVGVNIAGFAAIDRILFRPLPFRDPDRLVQISLYAVDDPRMAAAVLPYEITSAIRERVQGVTAIGWADGGARESSVNPGEPPLLMSVVTPNALDVLGIVPVLGHGFSESPESELDLPVLLTYETWQSRYGGASGVLDMRWKDEMLTAHVVGVLPPGFILPSSHYAEHVDAIAGRLPSRRRLGPGLLTVAPFARLRPGVAIGELQAELDSMMATYKWQSTELGDQFRRLGQHVSAQPLQAGLTALLRPQVTLVGCAMLAVFLIGCANFSVIWLARFHWSGPSFKIRSAIGASPSTLVLQSFFEAALVGVAGAVVALCVCLWSQGTLQAVLPSSFRGFAVSPLDPRVVAFAVGTTAGCALLASVIPAIRLSRLDTASLFAVSPKGRTGRVRGGGIILTMECALAAMLAVGAAAAVPSFAALWFREPGFDAKNLFVMTASPQPAAGAPKVDIKSGRFVAESLKAFASIPGVTGVAAALSVPFGHPANDSDFWLKQGMRGATLAVTADYFATLRSPMRAGRAFTDEEVGNRALVAIISETAARVLWPREPVAAVVGKTIRTLDGSRLVVGVSADLQWHPGVEVGSTLYIPVTASEAELMQSGLSMVVRTAPGRSPDPGAVSSVLRDQFNVAVNGPTPVVALMEPWLVRPRFLAILFGTLATIGLLLAATGVFALVSVEVAFRRHEAAVRLALGATFNNLRHDLMAPILSGVFVGAAVGLGVAWGWTTVLASRGTSVISPALWSYVVAGLAVVCVAGASMWLPLRRLANLDPTAVLRGE